MIKSFVRTAVQWALDREVVREAIARSVTAPASVPSGFIPNEHLRTSSAPPSTRIDSAPVFVTARFRSGSTLLWKLLREHPGVTAYYEPLNPRKWFDGESRGRRVDHSHRGVEEYWTEYDRIADENVPWQAWWPSQDLYLPPMKPAHQLHKYLKLLIDNAMGAAVLQFNRLDFRLAWVASRFPEAVIVHLQRNPRDQWLSTFLRHPPVSQSATVAQLSPCDEFYLLPWAKDLSRRIPLLAEVDDLHPYELSYLLSRLSETFASNYADFSLSYETLVANPGATMRELGETLNLEDLDRMSAVASISERSVGRWRKYADASWFAERENRCEELLEQCVFGQHSSHLNCVSG